MPEIIPIQPEQVEEARRVIYATAHAIFHDGATLEESIALYEEKWPLPDIADFQNTYRDSGGDFLVMVENGRIIGTGALRRLEDGIGEIKRLWFLPESQGKGLGYQMMMRLLEMARELGYHKVRLETSPAYQQRAFAFYQRLGFTVIPLYKGDEEDDTGMELSLA